jgi:E2F transcription factor CC-MB domain
MLEKKSKNQIQWSRGGNRPFCDAAELDDKMRSLQLAERLRLKQKENQLNSLIVNLKDDFSIQMDQKYAYVTCQDLNGVESFKDQLLITLRVPAESKLTVKHLRKLPLTSSFHFPFLNRFLPQNSQGKFTLKATKAKLKPSYVAMLRMKRQRRLRCNRPATIFWLPIVQMKVASLPTTWKTIPLESC